jgi:membrane protease YdiL (CAAX protease family)
LGRAALFALLLLCGLLVFVLGVDYHSRFPTNSSSIYKIGVTALFLLATGLLRRSSRFRPYWRVAFAFFAASLTNVLTWYCVGPLRDSLLGLFRLSPGTPQGLTVGKLSDALLRVVPMVLLVRLAGDDMGSIGLRRGNLKWALTLGLLGFVNYAASAVSIAGNQNADFSAMLPSIPWWLAYSLLNGFMEEIWYRTIFLSRLEPVIGSWPSVWLTSIWFGVSHVFATYVSGIGAYVFAVLVFTLGIAFALLIQKTKSIWGAVLFHAASDLHWFIAFGGF